MITYGFPYKPFSQAGKMEGFEDFKGRGNLFFDALHVIRLECFRLMGFADGDFYKVKQALMDALYIGKDRTNSQLYKLAGNSISVPMLKHIFCQMFDGENEFWIWKGW